MRDLIEDRKKFESLGAIYPPDKTVAIEKVSLAGVDNYWFIPSTVASREVIVYFHGGGYIYGSLQSHAAMVSHIASAIGRKILFVEYSLAPEKTFPTALNEATAVVNTLVQSAPDFQFAFMGDSAGGNLAMATALNLKNLSRPLPVYQVLISPWTNMNTAYKSYDENEKLDPILTRDFMQYASSNYTGGEQLNNPLISPVFGNYTGFAPTLILVGAEEILRDDALNLHDALEHAGCTSVLRVFNKVTHVWTLSSITSAESIEALRLIRRFVDEVAGVEKSKESSAQRLLQHL